MQPLLVRTGASPSGQGYGDGDGDGYGYGYGYGDGDGYGDGYSRKETNRVQPTCVDLRDLAAAIINQRAKPCTC